MTREDALKVGIELLKSVEEFHSKILIHGDIRLDNVVIGYLDDEDYILPATSRLIENHN